MTPPLVVPGLKAKSNCPILFELCKCQETDSLYVASLWDQLKIWCGNFQIFDFSGPKCIMLGSKTPFWPFRITLNAFLGQKNQNLENSRTRFLVCPTRMLRTKNHLPRTFTVQIKWSGSFFTSMFRDPFQPKSLYFGPFWVNIEI